MAIGRKSDLGAEPMLKQLYSTRQKTGMINDKNGRTYSGISQKATDNNAMTPAQKKSFVAGAVAGARATGVRQNANGNKAASVVNTKPDTASKINNAKKTPGATVVARPQGFSGSGKGASAGKSSATNSAKKSGGTKVGKVNKKP